MDVKCHRFIVGTKERPTAFLMYGGEMTDSIEDAELYKEMTNAECEIETCDEPDKLTIYHADVIVHGV